MCLYAACSDTVESLNKGHLRTEGIVPHSEVVPYWEVFHKKLNNDVKSPLKNTENLSAVLCSSGSTIQHQAVGMHTTHVSKEYPT